MNERGRRTAGDVPPELGSLKRLGPAIPVKSGSQPSFDGTSITAGLSASAFLSVAYLSARKTTGLGRRQSGVLSLAGALERELEPRASPGLLHPTDAWLS
jgi:hypothetical protein